MVVDVVEFVSILETYYSTQEIEKAKVMLLQI